MFYECSFTAGGISDSNGNKRDTLKPWQTLRSVAGHKASMAEWLAADLIGNELHLKEFRLGQVEHHTYMADKNEARELYLTALFVANWQAIMLHNHGPRHTRFKPNEETAQQASAALKMGNWTRPRVRLIRGISYSHLALLVTAGLKPELAPEHNYTTLLDGIINAHGDLKRLNQAELPALFKRQLV